MAVVRLAARDPGGANVLASLLRRCRSSLPLEPNVWSMPKAAEVFERAGVSASVFSEAITPDALEREWQRRPADLLITGTSHQEPFESALWELARQHSCPSLALLDQWCNLRSRFNHGWPDYIGAIDTVQAESLVQLGFPLNRVIVAGHPWLTDLLEWRRLQVAAPKAQDDREAVCVLFVSENIAVDVASGKNPPYGFDEIDSFDLLYRAACAAAELGTKVSLTVKLHPYEDPSRFRDFLSRLSPPHLVRITCLPKDADPRAWVLWSDLVVGISSMLLFEAMVLRRPVVSLQPGLVRENTFMASVNGYARTLTDPAKELSYLVHLIRHPEERRAALADHRAFTDALQKDCLESVLDWIRSRLPT